MAKQYRCECCHGVEYGEPHRMCGDCYTQHYHLREMAHEFRKRFDISYLDTHLAIKHGINKLMEKIRNLQRR